LHAADLNPPWADQASKSDGGRVIRTRSRSHTQSALAPRREHQADALVPVRRRAPGLSTPNGP
jgi:hypothetical protein